MWLCSISFSLLLYSKAFAFPIFPSNHSTSNGERNGNFTPPSEIHSPRNTNFARALDRRAGRSSKFMQNFVKGAQLWNQYFDAISDPGSIQQPADFAMELNEEPESLDSPGKLGWELRSGYDSEEETEDDEEAEPFWSSVPVDRDGWRYEEFEVYYGDDLMSTLDIIGNDDANVRAYTCSQWRNPGFSVTLNIDCEYGILINHNADLRFERNSGPVRASQRWSDLSWKLWTTVCPKEHHGNLQWIVQETITNEETKAALAEAATGRKRLNQQNPQANHLVTTVYTPNDLDFTLGNSAEPTCNQDVGECDFYSLLRAPNVIGAVHLLMDYADTMLYPYISHIITQSVAINRQGTSRTGWNLIIKLDTLSCD